MRSKDALKSLVISTAKRLYQKSPQNFRVPVYRWNLKRRIRFPRTIFIETTSACNLNCVMCPTQRKSAKRFKKDGFMSASLFRDLTDQIESEAPWTTVFLHKDGEPLLHPEIVEFIDYASSRVPDSLLVTNATLLNEEMSRAILSTPLQNIRFSVDGFDKQTFEKVRRQSKDNPYADTAVPVDYESVISNILRFCELKKSMGKYFPRVGMRITQFKATQDQISSYVSYWEKQVNFVNVVALLSWAGSIEREEEKTGDRHPCLELWDSMTINWDGTMAPCCVYVDSVGDGKGILADLKTISIREAWRSQHIQRLRLAHLDNDFGEVAPFCEVCRDWRNSSAPGNKLWNERFKAFMRARALE
jgi:uncharacterized Fe-S cluster-containing radical SAM superfamily protein